MQADPTVGGAHARLSDTLGTWFASHARDLPWRHPECSPWGVLTSEIMLQQTPVTRVVPLWSYWMTRWPTPTDLATASTAEVIRAWGTLGYPRRALRLQEAAVQVGQRFDGQLPHNDELITLPGIGDYTAAAVIAFAFNGRSVVLDTNIRRVLCRILLGQQRPTSSSPTRLERTLALSLVPEQDAQAANWSAAVMEFGALVCKANQPECAVCPVADVCTWRSLGYPVNDSPSLNRQAFEGTDRQARGRIMALLRGSDQPVTLAQISEQWEPADQRMRALDTLIADGLVEPLPEERFRVPIGSTPSGDHPIAHLSATAGARSV
ncbi:MAG: A/G-specific adenine glycosylase [Actinomycetes bacterium]